MSVLYVQWSTVQAHVPEEHCLSILIKYLKLFNPIWSIISDLFMCVYMCTCNCGWPWGPGKGVRFPEVTVVKCGIWVLGTKLQYLGRATSVLHCWAPESGYKNPPIPSHPGTPSATQETLYKLCTLFSLLLLLTLEAVTSLDSSFPTNVKWGLLCSVTFSLEKVRAEQNCNPVAGETFP